MQCRYVEPVGTSQRRKRIEAVGVGKGLALVFTPVAGSRGQGFFVSRSPVFGEANPCPYDSQNTYP